MYSLIDLSWEFKQQLKKLKIKNKKCNKKNSETHSHITDLKVSLSL